MIRPIGVPGTYDGRIDANSCRSRFGIGVLDLLRFDVGGAALTALVHVTPDFAAIVTPLRTAEGYVLGTVAPGTTGRWLVVLPAGRAADPQVGFAVGTVLVPADGDYRVTTTRDPSPSSQCIPTFTVRGVAFDSWLDEDGCVRRDVVLVPPVAAGATLRATATATGTRVRLRVIERATGRTLATATAPGDGRPATIEWRNTGAANGVTLRLELADDDDENVRVRVTIE